MSTPEVNLLDPHFYVDPWDAYRWLRDEAPVFWDPVQQLWGISRYADVVALEKQGQLYSSVPGSRPKIDQHGDQSMINLDDPDHQAQRNLVARRFTPRAARSHEDHVRAVVTEILDAVAPLGECEAIEAIASRLPAMMICELLGYPPEMWEKIRYWSEETMHQGGQTNPAGAPHFDLSSPGGAGMEFAELTVPLIEQRRADPQDDLISVWAHHEGWDIAKVLQETILVLDGGAETTRTVIGSIIRELALRPDQRQLLVDDPGLLSTTAVEEFIRWVSPVLNMRRTATADHELHGQQISAGDELLLLYPSANRDERAFDDPDTFDVTRPGNRHVAFGFGTHFCLGSHLARLEIRVMFEELLARMPDWELVDPAEPQIVPATFARAYDRIRIRFS
ncbi:MAG: cytochrome P450 [Acidimicrobiales bacterium]|nr:cytochrome P450 [Acidimicrobiales bacterium]